MDFLFRWAWLLMLSVMVKVMRPVVCYYDRSYGGYDEGTQSVCKGCACGKAAGREA